jgi:hypothetical protein
MFEILRNQVIKILLGDLLDTQLIGLLVLASARIRVVGYKISEVLTNSTFNLTPIVSDKVLNSSSRLT